MNLVLPAMILSILEAGIFVKDETSKIDDVLMEHGGLPHLLPLAVYLKFLGGQVEGNI